MVRYRACKWQYVILFSSQKRFEAASYMITDSVPAYNLWSRSEADKQNFADMKLSLHSTVQIKWPVIGFHNFTNSLYSHHATSKGY